MKKAIIVDMDGTISNTSKRKNLVPKSGGSWDDFHKTSTGDLPTAIMAIVNDLSKIYDIIISTARPDTYRSLTMEWLVRHATFKPASIYMRLDLIKKSPEIKFDHLTEMKALYAIDVAFAIDDRKDICQMYESNGIPAWNCPENFVLAGPKEALPEVKDFPAPPKSKPPKNPKSKKPEEYLMESASIFMERNSQYGDSYKDFGDLLFALHPEGLEIKTKKQMSRLGTYVMILAKIHRYAKQFEDGGHNDSLRDLSVYSAMQRELDELNKS